jgi:hypothetical protein
MLHFGCLNKIRVCAVRNAPLVVFAGWFLVINYGATYPKDGSSIDMGRASAFGGPSFNTKVECEEEGKRLVQAFYTEVRTKREKVAWPTTFQCRQKENLK